MHADIDCCHALLRLVQTMSGLERHHTGHAPSHAHERPQLAHVLADHQRMKLGELLCYADLHEHAKPGGGHAGHVQLHPVQHTVRHHAALQVCAAGGRGHHPGGGSRVQRGWVFPALKF